MAHRINGPGTQAGQIQKRWLAPLCTCLTLVGCGGGSSSTTTTQTSLSLTASPEVVEHGGFSTLTWSSGTPTSCTASGGWSGSKPASGSARVGPLYRSTTFSLNCSSPEGNALAMLAVDVFGTVRLRWEPPTANVDGTPLADLAGYHIYHGTTSGRYGTQIVVDDAELTEYQLTLRSGSYYIAMTALDSDGNESSYSNEVLRTVD